ncbi:hypothetical protein BHM03_00047775 [Ensete ventricosum]|nr:hypothetical protein BHM03_00047775 [Ensete ventricosum]
MVVINEEAQWKCGGTSGTHEIEMDDRGAWRCTEVLDRSRLDASDSAWARSRGAPTQSTVRGSQVNINRQIDSPLFVYCSRTSGRRQQDRLTVCFSPKEHDKDARIELGDQWVDKPKTTREAPFQGSTPPGYVPQSRIDILAHLR